MARSPSTLIILFVCLRLEAPAAHRSVALSSPAMPGALAAGVQPARARSQAPAVRESYIIQAASAGEAGSAVVRVGGRVTGDLSVIRAVRALLDSRELEALKAANVPGLTVYADSKVKASSTAGALPVTWYPSEIGAQELQAGGITGSGVTVAVVDSGLWNQHGPDQSAPGNTASRIVAQYDVIAANEQSAPRPSWPARRPPRSPPIAPTSTTRSATARTSPRSSPAAALPATAPFRVWRRA